MLTVVNNNQSITSYHFLFFVFFFSFFEKFLQVRVINQSIKVVVSYAITNQGRQKKKKKKEKKNIEFS